MKDVTLICYGTREARLLDPGPTLVGRDLTCDLRIPALEASRRHCLIVVDEAGGVSISDLGSANGTSVNGRRIEGTLRLTNGDLITVAGVHFQCRIQGVPSEMETLRMAVEQHATLSARVA